MSQILLPRLTLPAFVAAQFILFAHSASAQIDGSWKDDASGNWSTPSAWVSGTVPGGAGSVVNIANDITASRTVTIDAVSRTVGILNIGDATGNDAFVVTNSGGASLLFDNGGSSAELNFTAASGFNVVSAPISLLSSLTLQNSSSDTQTISGTVSAGSAGLKTITNLGSGTGGVTFSSTISNGTGTVAVTQNSASSLTLLGSNSYSGNTTLSAGTLQVGSATALGSGTLVLNGGTLSSNSANSRSVSNAVVLGGNVTIGDPVNTGQLTMGGATSLTGNRTVSVAAGGHAFWSGAIAQQGGVHSFTKDGGGILTLSGSNEIGGGITVNAGTLRIGGNRTLGSGTLTLNGGTLSASSATARGISNAVAIKGDITLGDTTTTGVLTFSGATTLTGNRTLTLKSDVTVSGVIGDGGGGHGLTKSGSATLTLSGNNTYSGATSINGGSLHVTSTGRINASSGIAVQGGARLVYNSATALTSALSLDGSGASGRAVLSGTGTINSAITLNDLGDTLAPGESPGTMTFGVGQSWDSFTYDWEVNNFAGTVAGADFDQISIMGSLDLNSTGSYVLNLQSLTAGNQPGLVGGFEEGDQSWTILTTTGGITDFHAGNWSIETAGFVSDPLLGGSLSVDTSLDGNSLLLVYQSVPEPSSIALLGAVALASGAAFRRRFRR